MAALTELLYANSTWGSCTSQLFCSSLSTIASIWAIVCFTRSTPPLPFLGGRSWWNFPNAKKLVDRLRKLWAKLEAVVSRALGCKFGSSDRIHVGSAAETISEEQDVSVASRRDRKGAEVIDANGNARPFGQWHRDDGPPDRQPRGFPCLTLQALAKPLPDADAHTNPPVKTFEHLQCARCAEVAGRCRVASLHAPRAQQRYVNANRLIVQ